MNQLAIAVAVIMFPGIIAAVICDVGEIFLIDGKLMGNCFYGKKNCRCFKLLPHDEGLRSSWRYDFESVRAGSSH